MSASVLPWIRRDGKSTGPRVLTRHLLSVPLGPFSFSSPLSSFLLIITIHTRSH